MDREEGQLIRVAVVEDEKSQANRMRDYLERYAREKEKELEIVLFSDGQEFVDSLKQGFDIALLDIQMKRLDGMQAAEAVRQVDEEMILIFITNLVQYAIRGYSVSAMNYLLKPLSYGTFAVRFDEAVKRRERRRGKILEIRTDRGYTRLLQEEIRCVEIINRKLAIYTAEKEFFSTETMQSLEARLDPRMFFRCHVAYLVNLGYVRQVLKSTAMVGDKEVLISKHRRREFLDALTSYMGEEIG